MTKVQGMMPIVGRKQHVDKETDQVVEGSCLLSSVDVHVSDQFVGTQTGNSFSRMMSVKQTRRLSSFYRWPMHGKTHRHERLVPLGCFLGSPPPTLRARMQSRALALVPTWIWQETPMLEATRQAQMTNRG